MAGEALADVKRRARRWARAWGEGAEVREAQTMVGGGSLPGQGIATWCAVVRGDHVDRLHDMLRSENPAIVGRIEDGALWLDPRTVAPGDVRYVERVLRSCSGNI
ncbi:MAG: hypothetical protein U5Q44_14575 [Dehalococcoidia bacterium]|nr:hypothetical protein [Dehalococcoidia bacterium]